MKNWKLIHDHQTYTNQHINQSYKKEKKPNKQNKQTKTKQTNKNNNKKTTIIMEVGGMVWIQRADGHFHKKNFLSYM